MLSVALDTSTPLGSVALAEDTTLLAESLLSVRATHSETMIPEVERLLAICGGRWEDVGTFVVGAGPGSFTGVRIAASLAKGFCFAGSASLYAYSSLWAVAAGSGLDDRVCALFDARRGEVYAAAYRALDPPETELGPVARPLEEILDGLSPAEWSFVGEGALVNRGSIEARGGRVLPPHLAHPRGSTLLWLAHRWPELGLVKDPALWEPQYARSSGAQRIAQRTSR